MLSITKIEEAIDAFTMSDPSEEHHIVIPPRRKERNYLGMSGLGDICIRAIWYGFRKCHEKKFPPRLYRLFRRGDREEYVFVWLLRGIGFKVHDVDENGKQFKVSDFGGHLSGHTDGVGEAPKKFWIKGTTPQPFLLEFKSYNDNRFKTLRKQKVRRADPKYYGQMQLYMGYEELKGALFCAVNKNDDSLYFEWVPFSKSAFNELVGRAETVLSADSPPERIANTPSDFRCRFCEAKGLCFSGEASLKSCYSCKHAEVLEDAKWGCSKGKDFGTTCKKYEDIASA